MPSATATSVVLSQVSFDWPDGSPVLREVSTTFGAGRTGLLGDNGSGKSTVLRLMVGALTATQGTIRAPDDVAYLPQDLVLDSGATLADLVGVRRKLDALRAVESGAVEEELFDVIGGDWDVEQRAQLSLERAGLAVRDLGRPVTELSGGEVVLAAVSGLWMRAAPVTLLDEPTNNLDRDARQRLYDLVRAWPGTLIVASHDVTLLDLMDETAELRDGEITVFGGGFTAFREYVASQQQAVERALRTARQTLRTERRQRVEAETKLARRRRYAQKEFENKRMPKVVMNQRKTEAQVSAGKLRGQLDSRVEAAARSVERHADMLRDDPSLRIALPDPRVPASRHLAEIDDGEHAWSICGPERVALTGPNGAGKTRLVEALVRATTVGIGRLRATAQTDRIGYLPQRLDHIDDEGTVLENVRAVAPRSAPGAVRASLARFLLRGDDVHRPAGELSGGERFRVAMARLLLADPPAQLLVLDEPTNNLDLSSVEALVSALGEYRGGLLVVSHDDVFLERLGIDRRLQLDMRARLTAVETLPR